MTTDEILTGGGGGHVDDNGDVERRSR